MAQSQKLELIVEGKDAGGSKLLDDVNKQLSDTDSKLKQVQDTAANGIDIDAGSGDVAGTLNEAAKGADALATGLKGAGASGAEAGSAIAGSLGAAGVVAGALSIAVGAVVAAFTILISKAVEAVNAAKDWGETVDAIQDVTGVSAELASTLAEVAILVGESPEVAARAFAALAKNVEQANIAIRKIHEDELAAYAAAEEKRVELNATNNERIADIRTAGAVALERLQEQQTEREAEFAARKLDAERQLGQSIADIRAAEQERLANLDERRVDRIAAANADIADVEADAARASAEQQRDYDQQRVADRAKLTQRLGDLERNHVDDVADLQERITEATADANTSIAEATQARIDDLNEAEHDHAQTVGDLAERISETRADALTRNAEREAEYQRTIEKGERDLTERLEELAERRADRIRSFTQDIGDLQDSFSDRQAERQERLAERLENLDDSTASKRESIQQNINNARDEFEERALQAELAGFDERTAKQRAEIEAKAAAEDAKAQAAFDKKLSRLQERIKQENDVFEKQNAGLIAKARERETELGAANERETAKAVTENAKRIADLEERIARENAAYALQTAAIEAEFAKRTADISANSAKELSDLRARLAAEQEEYTQQTTRLQAEYDARATAQSAAFARETAEAARISAERISDLQARITTENAQYAEQSAGIVADADARVTRLNETYTRNTANAEAQLTKQTADNQAAQLAAYNATIDRLNKEQAAYTKTQAAIDKSLNEFLRNAQQQTPPVVEGLRLMGLRFDDIKNLKPEEQFDAILSALGKMPDGTGKAAAAQLLFNEAGRGLINVAELYTTQSLPKWIEQTERLGKLMNQDAVNAAVNLGTKQREVKEQFDGLFVSIGKDLLPKFLELIIAFNEFATKNAPGIKQAFDEITGAVNGLFGALKAVFDFLNGAGGQKIGAVLNGPLFNTDAANQSITDFFGGLFGGGAPGQTQAPVNTAPVGGTPAANNYIVNATYTQAAPPSPAEITRTLTLLNP